MILDFIDGLSLLGSTLKNITNEGMTSPSINSTITTWDLIAKSILPGQVSAISTLKSLNNMISCGGTSLQFNRFNCTNSNCQEIINSTGFVMPSCASSKASEMFQNLQNFVIDESLLMMNMINDLNSTEIGVLTPNSLQIGYRNQFQQSSKNFQVISATLGRFLIPANVFSDGFLRNCNCTIVRNQLSNLNDQFCSDFNNSVFFIGLLLLTVGFIFLLSLWCFFCASRQIRTVNDKIVPNNGDKASGESLVKSIESYSQMGSLRPKINKEYMQHDLENIIY